jgi:hypothetical protein
MSQFNRTLDELENSPSQDRDSPNRLVGEEEHKQTFSQIRAAVISGQTVSSLNLDNRLGEVRTIELVKEIAKRLAVLLVTTVVWLFRSRVHFHPMSDVS